MYALDFNVSLTFSGSRVFDKENLPDWVYQRDKEKCQKKNDIAERKGCLLNTYKVIVFSMEII